MDVKNFIERYKLLSEEEREELDNQLLETSLSGRSEKAEIRGGHFIRKVSDWDAIRDQYVKGVWSDDLNQVVYPTISELAETYGVAHGTVQAKASEGQWRKMRTLLKAKLKEKREGRELRALVSESAQYDALALQCIQKILRLQEVHFERYREVLDEEVELGEIPKAELPTIDPRELQILATTTEKLVGLTRAIIGDDSVSSIQEEIKNIRKEGIGDTGSDEKVSDLQKQLQEIRNVRASLKEKRNNKKKAS